MSSSLDLIGKGLLPFMGGMRRFIPFLLNAAQEVVPMRQWPDWSFHDMTCGSCAGSATFAFYGMSITANDLALRSIIPANALFYGQASSGALISKVISNPAKLPQGLKPAVELAEGKLHPIACDIFDRLYYASSSEPLNMKQKLFFEYLAIRWVLLNKNYMYFLKLPTLDLDQLAIQSPTWKKTVDMLRDPLPALLKVREEIMDLSVALQSANPQRLPFIIQDDCRESIKHILWDRPSFVNLNPPTDGNARFMQSNRMLDALLYNEPQPQKDGMMPGDLWRSLILDTCKHIPTGHYVFSFVGDGAVSWEEGCSEVFSKVGPIIKEWSFPWHGSETRKAGLVLMRKA
jgi:hypothetical protein